MKVAIRVDASHRIGTGHVRRTDSLAQALLSAGARVNFVWRDLGVDVSRMISRGCDSLPPLAAPGASRIIGESHASWAGVDWAVDAVETSAALSAEPPDWLIVDHYSLDARWHERVRAALGSRILAVDDLGDRPLSADILIDHNLHADHRVKYRFLDPPPLILAGPHYALLNGKYATAERYAFSEQVRSIGVFMGGSDEANMSETILRLLETSALSCRIEVVTTRANPNLDRLRRRVAESPLEVSLSVNLDGLEKFYVRHDLQIGAGGGAALERCCLGAPSIVLIVAENQRSTVPELDRIGAVAGFDATSLDERALADLIGSVIADPERRRAMRLAGMRLVDGLGASRVAEIMVQM